jgi:hypothetical protein
VVETLRQLPVVETLQSLVVETLRQLVMETLLSLVVVILLSLVVVTLLLVAVTPLLVEEGRLATSSGLSLLLIPHHSTPASAAGAAHKASSCFSQNEGWMYRGTMCSLASQRFMGLSFLLCP